MTYLGDRSVNLTLYPPPVTHLPSAYPCPFVVIHSSLLLLLSLTLFSISCPVAPRMFSLRPRIFPFEATPPPPPHHPSSSNTMKMIVGVGGAIIGAVFSVYYPVDNVTIWTTEWTREWTAALGP